MGLSEGSESTNAFFELRVRRMSLKQTATVETDILIFFFLLLLLFFVVVG